MTAEMDTPPEGGVIPVRAFRWIGAGALFVFLSLQAGYYWSSDVLAGMVG